MQNILKIRFKETADRKSQRCRTRTIRICFSTREWKEAIDYLAQVRDRIAHFWEFRLRDHGWCLLHLQWEGRSANVSLTKAKFLLYFRSFLLLGSFLISLFFILFFFKNLTDVSSAPNSGPVLNNWLMSGTLAVTGMTSLAALTHS